MAKFDGHFKIRKNSQSLVSQWQPQLAYPCKINDREVVFKIGMGAEITAAFKDAYKAISHHKLQCLSEILCGGLYHQSLDALGCIREQTTQY